MDETQTCFNPVCLFRAQFELKFMLEFCSADKHWQELNVEF